MDETEAIIERTTQVNQGFQHLELAIDQSLRKKIKPGHSLLVRAEDQEWHPYLREQWWPVSVNRNKLVVERPIGKRYDAGALVNIIGPVGQPYRFRRTLRNVMLLAYDTSPTPLLMTIPWLLGNSIGVTLVLVGSAREYATQHLNPEVEIIHGEEDVTWAEQVMTIGWADQVFAAVGEDDSLGQFKEVLERFRELRADVPRNYLFGVFQPVICCGTGACLSCMLQMRKGTQLICTDGPAFDLTQVVVP
jgi:hypothetical protein